MKDTHSKQVLRLLTALFDAGWVATDCTHSRKVNHRSIMRAVREMPYEIVIQFAKGERAGWVALHPQTGDDSHIVADWSVSDTIFDSLVHSA